MSVTWNHPLFPSTENKYTFDSDPSELGARLISKAS